jgi:hypothetical protein
MSKLCQICANFDISESDFQTTDLVDTINMRARDCELCSLFSDATLDLGMQGHETFVCQRIASSLRVWPSGKIILSIYSDPGTNARIIYLLLPYLHVPQFKMRPSPIRKLAFLGCLHLAARPISYS